MADFTVNFGVKTRVGFGGYDVSETPGSAITGTGADDWYINSAGEIVPGVSGAAGTYGNAKTFSKAAGETYNLTLNSGATIDITLVADAAHCNTNSADTISSNQLKSYITQSYATTGALEYGDTLYLRDGYRFDWIGASANITPSSNGLRGHLTVTNPGSGYPTGNLTYYNVEATGGSGTGCYLVVVTSGSQVVQVYANYPGTGYQLGDVLTAAAFPGAEFTVIDMDAVVTVRSETIGTTHTFDGRNFGGSAQILALEFGGTTVSRCPWTFQYIGFLYDIEDGLNTPEHIFTYRSKNRWGVGFENCYFANSDGVLPANIKQTAIDARGAAVNNCYIYRVQRGFEDAPNSDNQYVTEISENVIRTVYVDGLSMGAQFPHYLVTDNFFLDVYIENPASHSDFFQHQGARDAGDVGFGIAHQDFGTCARNICVIGTTPSANNLAGQGSAGFFTDGLDPTRYGGMVTENNIGITLSGNAQIATRFSGPIARRNTLLTAIDAPNYQGELDSTIRWQYGEDGEISNNFVNAINVSLQNGTVTQTNNTTVAMDVDLYRIAFPNYAWGPFSTRAAVIAALTPAVGVAVADGGAMNPDGTYRGALFPDGSWNDGTVYQATPATYLTAAASSPSVTTGQPVTITIQADSPVSGDVAVDPSVSGVTGSFSPDPATITSGTASKATVFTPTSAGTAYISFTNDGGLTNPDLLAITVTAPATDPTSYTSGVNVGATASIGQTITLTFTLDAPATDPVTITGSFSGVSGAWLAGSSVVIGNGDLSGSLSWISSSQGTVTFSSTNDFSLPNPANIQVQIVGCTAAQLIALGIR